MGVWYSAFAEHAIQTDHNLDWNSIKILASDSKAINLVDLKVSNFNTETLKINLLLNFCMVL